MLLFKLFVNFYILFIMDVYNFLNLNLDKKRKDSVLNISQIFFLFFKYMVLVVSYNLMVGEICYVIKFSCKYNYMKY